MASAEAEQVLEQLLLTESRSICQDCHVDLHSISWRHIDRMRDILTILSDIIDREWYPRAWLCGE